MDARTGTVKMLFSPGQAIGFNGLVWEDDTHVLAMVRSAHTQSWYPVRFGMDGSVEKADTVPLLSSGTNGLLYPNWPELAGLMPFN